MTVSVNPDPGPCNIYTSPYPNLPKTVAIFIDPITQLL
jgi:hypothetical protein